jgi:NADH-quinone oxidoreductase subunit C
MSATGQTIKRLADTFGPSLTMEQAGDQTAVVVGVDKLREVLLFLKTDETLSYSTMTDLFAIDRYGREPRFEVVYLLNSIKLAERLVLKVRVADGESIPTVSDIWLAAEWLEREAYDMFGLRFDNHPDLRRILMVEDFEGYPLRKDFPTEGYGFDQPFKVVLEEEAGSAEDSGSPSKKVDW